MSMRVAPTERASVEVEPMAPRILFTRFLGRLDKRSAEEGWHRFDDLVRTMERPLWLSDARGLTGFDRDTVPIGERWYKSLLGAGGDTLLVVSSWPAATMAASSSAFAFGVRMLSFAELEEAKRKATALLLTG